MTKPPKQAPPEGQSPPVSSGTRDVPLSMPLYFRARNGYRPNLADPHTFNELMQVRKLVDRNPLFPILADKVKVKAWAEERLGADWIIPTIWHGTALPGRIIWPTPFVLKSNHGSQQCLFVRSDDADWDQISRTARGWLKKTYGKPLHEWLYGQIEPQLLIEPFVGDSCELPVDYKFFVFGGRAHYVQVDTDREHDHKRTLFTLDWERLPLRLRYPMDPRPIEKPGTLPRLIEAAELLGRGFDFVRVDFYEVGGKPLFGEMTFYANSGLDKFTPVSFDHEFGALWRAAAEKQAS